MFNQFMTVMQPDENTTILDVGVTSDDVTPGANFFEKLYPYKHRITCAGLEDARHLETKYPGVSFTKLQVGEPLPFENNHFDIVFHAAVMEHVGSQEAQRSFLHETLRVAKRFFVITPNRWFPIEVHTNLPFVHWLPPQTHRWIFRRLGFSFYAEEQNLNLLGRSDLRHLFPPGAVVRFTGHRIVGMVSNLIAYGESRSTV
jgi:SAM-dependent methyltransferase